MVRVLWVPLLAACCLAAACGKGGGGGAERAGTTPAPFATPTFTPGGGAPTPAPTASATPGPGFPALLLPAPSAQPRYVVDAHGTFVPLLGSHTWANLQDRLSTFTPRPFAWDAYLGDLERWGHDFIRLWVWEGNDEARVNEPQPFLRVGGALAPDDALMDAWVGPADHGRFDLRQRNPAYFARLRARVLDAGARGLYVGVMLFQGASAGGAASDWAYHPYAAAMNVNGIDADPDGDGRSNVLCDPDGPWAPFQRQYVGWVLDAVNDLANVVYELTNEAGICATLGEVEAWHAMIEGHLRAEMARRGIRHLVWRSDYHVGPGGLAAGNASLFRSAAELVSPTRIEGAYTSRVDQMKNGRCEGGPNDEADCATQAQCPGGECEHMPPPGLLQFADLPPKPSLLDSDHIQCIRDLADGFCLTDGIASGADWVWKAVTRGHQPLFMDGYQGDYGGGNDGEQTTRDAMGHALAYLRRLDLATAVPRVAATSTRLALETDGEWLLYQPEAGAAFTLDVTPAALATRRWIVEWFDVAAGRVASGDGGTREVLGGAIRTLVPPRTITGPAVAFLTTAPAGDPGAAGAAPQPRTPGALATSASRQSPRALSR